MATPDQPLISGIFDHINEGKPVRHCWFGEDGESYIDIVGVVDYPSIFEQLFYHLLQRVVFQAIGHRVVHGGMHFSESVLIDASVLEVLQQLIPLAPLHNSTNIMGIEMAHRHYPQLPQVAVFDTAFHYRLPAMAQCYALPIEVQQQYQIRRFGFHGISHQYLANEVAQQIGRPLNTLKLITLHLGNGASVAAIREGQCIDTSMGMTPLEGLVMGTRCGDLDAGVVMKLVNEGYDVDALDNLLNHQSGLLGLCGSNDMRVIEQQVKEGDASAKQALEIYCYRIKKYIGAYVAALGGLDALVFSGGVGEHSAEVRRMCCEGLTCLGIKLDAQRNQQGEANRRIDSANASCTVWVIASNEALEIARQTQYCLHGKEAP